MESQQITYQPFGDPSNGTDIHWNRNAPRYRCCCSTCCHIKVGAWIIGILHALGQLLNVIFAILFWVGVEMFQTRGLYISSATSGMLAGHVIEDCWCMIQIIILIIFFCGLVQEKSALVFPQVVIQAMNIVFETIGLVILIIVFAATVHSLDRHCELCVIIFVCSILLYVGVFALTIWFYTITYRFYRFLRDQEAQSRQQIAFALPAELNQSPEQNYNPSDVI